MMIYEARRLGKDEVCLIFVWFVLSRCPTIALVRESGLLGFGIQNIAQGILNPTDDWNPGSKFH